MGTAKKATNASVRKTRKRNIPANAENAATSTKTIEREKLHPFLQVLYDQRAIQRVLAAGGDLATEEDTKHIRFFQPVKL